MKNFVLFLASAALNLNLGAQGLDWVTNIGGSSFTFPGAMTIDPNGNIYVTGTFDSDLSFDMGSNGIFTLNSGGLDDAFVAKYSADGVCLWAKGFGGSLPDYGTGIAVDEDGNVYSTGVFQSFTDFDPGSGFALLDPEGASDVYIQKLDAEGNFVWVQQFGGPSQDRPAAIEIDHEGNVIIAGFYQGNVDFNPGPLVEFKPSVGGSRDAFIWKLNSSGNYIWGAQLGGGGTDVITGLATDQEGNIYTTGTFIGTADFNPGMSSNTLTAQSTNQDVFISKLDASGNYVWARRVGGFPNDYSYQLAVDDQQNVYTGIAYQGVCSLTDIGGTSTNSAQFEDVLFIKLNQNGMLSWLGGVVGNQFDRPVSVTLDQDNNFYAMGTFGGSGAEFDPGFNTDFITTNGAEDIFLTKYSTNGEYQWTQTFGGLADDQATQIKLGSGGEIVSFGGFTGTVDFDPFSPISNLTAQNSDIFIQKISQCSQSSSKSNVTACNSYTSPSGEFTWTESGTYQDILINAQGCDSVINILLTIQTVDTGVIDFSPSLFATATNAEYQWLDCNNDFAPISDATNQEFQATTNGLYAVMVTQGSCIEISECVSVTNVRVDEAYIGEINVYPNPGQGLFTLTGLPKDAISLDLYNSTGSLVKSTQQNSTGILNLELNEPAGLYILKISGTESKLGTLRLIKLD